MKTEDEKPSIPEITGAILSVFANRPVTDPEVYRQHILKTQVYAAMERWGYDARFRQELPKMHPSQGAAFRQLVKRMAGKGAIVALVGPRGLGKTSICAQFAKDVAWHNYDETMKESGPRLIRHAIYKKCMKLVARYKPLYADFGSIETEPLLESLDRLCRDQDFLIIDELHECEDMKMKSRVLTDLIDRRYSACLDTVLVANQTPDDFQATIGDSILSRLNEHGCIIECRWPTYRQQA